MDAWSEGTTGVMNPDFDALDSGNPSSTSGAHSPIGCMVSSMASDKFGGSSIYHRYRPRVDVKCNVAAGPLTTQDN